MGVGVLVKIHKENGIHWFEFPNSPVILIKSICYNLFQVFNGRITVYSGNSYNDAFREFKKESIRLEGLV